MATRVLPREKWQPEGTGEHYAGERWAGGPRRARRDPRLVERLLERHGVGAGVVLDAACGTGRLRRAIGVDGRHWVGVDVSASMLGQARAGGAGRLVRADVERLPFARDTFDAVVACRLLHHLREPEELTRVLRELVRVSAGPVIVSFWNRASLPGLRRRLGWGRDEGPNGRVARTTEELRAAADEAGARVLEISHVMPWLSQQSFAVLREERV